MLPLLTLLLPHGWTAENYPDCQPAPACYPNRRAETHGSLLNSLFNKWCLDTATARRTIRVAAAAQARAPPPRDRRRRRDGGQPQHMARVLPAHSARAVPLPALGRAASPAARLPPRHAASLLPQPDQNGLKWSVGTVACASLRCCAPMRAAATRCIRRAPAPPASLRLARCAHVPSPILPRMLHRSTRT